MIDAEKASYPVAWMCLLLKVPRSSFYAWRNQAESPSAARRRELAILVKKAFKAGRGAYGCRRVAAQLNRDGHPCSVGLVADLMREAGLRACQPRAYKRTTVPGEQPVTSPDLISRDFTADAPGQKLVGDITYLRTGEGWLYLATVIDLATRMVTGWQLASHMRTSLVTDALAMAITHGHVAPGVIFHSDKGAQYTSAEFTRFCAASGVRTSTGRTGVSLGQRRCGELLLGSEERDVPPAGLPRPGPRPVRILDTPQDTTRDLSRVPCSRQIRQPRDASSPLAEPLPRGKTRGIVLMSVQREELLRLVEELPESEVPVVLDDVRRHLSAGRKREWPPTWFGAGRGSASDIAARSEELLEDGFGRSV